MDSTLEHAENEDKHLVSQVAGISNYPHTVSVSSERGSMSFGSEHGRHLASVVINNANSPSKININPIFNVDFREYFYHPINLLYAYINLTSNICNSSSNCKCNCSCISKCKGEFICLCLCNPGSADASNGFCICVCKNENKKCICICICKNGQNCGSGAHQCKECLIKVDLGYLKDKSGRILKYLCWIKCCICKLENTGKQNNCSCSQEGASSGQSCQNGQPSNTCSNSCTTSSQVQCCCINGGPVTCNSNHYKDAKISYLSMLLMIDWVELRIEEISEKVGDLIKLKNILTLMCLFATKCAKCPDGCCKDTIKKLIEYSEKAASYYYLFGSRRNEIGPFVEYKFFYSKSKEILSSLEKSIKCMLEVNKKIMKDTPNANFTTISNRFLTVYSNYSILQCYLVISNLCIYSSKLSNELFINLVVEKCQCVKDFKKINNNNKFDMVTFYKDLLAQSNKNGAELKKLFVITDGNHICLCLVIMFVLYPSLIESMYCLRYFYLEAIAKQTREFIKNNYTATDINDNSKMLFIIIDITYKLTIYILSKYEYSYIIGGINFENICFCKYSSDPYYNYLVSSILYLSSLIENIWAIDNRAIVTAIESLSNLYSDLTSYDCTTKDIRPVRCNRICGLLVHKKCGQAASKKCCWCVTIVNVLVACVSLCIQFRFYEVYKALCKNNSGVSEEIKKFCEELDCKCTCEDKGLCCLLKLALASQLCNSPELEDWLKKCCESCEGQPEGCCKEILGKVKSGEADLLVIGCKCETEGEQVKVQCVIFKNPWGGRSAAIIIFCKCQDTKCCCLKNVIEKLNGESLKKLCNECQCEQLKNSINTLCPNGCGDKCPCEQLKKDLPKICGEGDCLCKKIKDLGNLCSKTPCKCKAEKCCRCVCCKLAIAGVRVLTEACKLNVLEPYKRVIIDLLSGSTDKQVIRSIVNSINNRTLNITVLVKNNYSTHFNSSIDHKNITNRFPKPTMGYAYDTVYEHQEASNGGYSGTNGIRKGYPNIGNRRIKIRNKL